MLFYRQGSNNFKADALSWQHDNAEEMMKPQYVLLPTARLAMLHMYTEGEIVSAVPKNSACSVDQFLLFVQPEC